MNSRLQLTAAGLDANLHPESLNGDVAWQVNNELGTIDGEVEASFVVNVDVPPVILEDFESGLSRFKAGSAAAASVSISETRDQDFIRNGDAALKLSYDFTGMTGTSGAYLQTVSTSSNIAIPGYPEKLGMWVYGDGKKHWLRAQLRDGENKVIAIDLTSQSVGVDWVGWRYVEAAIPQGRTLPLTIDMPVRYMETNNLKKDSGAIYIDDIRAIYGPLNEDRDPPVIASIYPLENMLVETETPEIMITAADAGYDPLQHPGTTLIDPDKIRLYVDGEQVNFGFYPHLGRISYTPVEPLSEGRHHVKVAVRDMDGNQTIKEWYFKINLGSPFYEYQVEEKQLLGHTYTFDISVIGADRLDAGELEIVYTAGALTDIELIPNEGPAVDLLQLEVDYKRSLFRLTIDNLTGTGLGGEDLLAQISYRINPEFYGPYTRDQIAGGPVKAVQFYAQTAVVKPSGKPGTSVNFSGDSLEARVEPSYKLMWDPYAIAKGFPAAFSVVNRETGTGAAIAIEGAQLLLNGSLLADYAADAAGYGSTALATLTAGSYKLQAVKGDDYSSLMTFVIADYAGTEAPSNINVTMGNDARTSRNLTWHTNPSVTNTVVEYVRKDEFVSFESDNIIRHRGSSSLYTTNNAGTIRVHKAELTGLEPGTEYVYRVGNGSALVSGQGVLRTSETAPEVTRLLFFGDSQAGKLAGFELWGETLRAGLNDMPDADLIVHAGDMVDKGYEQEQWNWWFQTAQSGLMNYTLIPIIGNHEVMGNNGNGDYLAQFNNPSNGAEGVKGTSFSYDIGDTHFVVLSTEMGSAGIDEQVAWLKSDLATSDKKWTIVFFHQGPYGSIYTNEKVQSAWVPIFDQYAVDLVMNGHDHIYMRTHVMNGGQAVEAGDTGTLYVIGGSSGPKFYDRTVRPWQDVVYDEDNQVYSMVEISANRIEVVVKTKEGNEVDRFELG